MLPYSVEAAYRFVDLSDAAPLCEWLLARASAARLKGTLPIAPEDINFTLTGVPGALEGWLAQSDPRPPMITNSNLISMRSAPENGVKEVRCASRKTKADAFLPRPSLGLVR